MSGEKAINEMTFEEALKKLEILVEKMEKEELPLEESLKYFEEGMELAGHCRKLLSEAEYKLEMMLKNGEKVDFEQFDD